MVIVLQLYVLALWIKSYLNNGDNYHSLKQIKQILFLSLLPSIKSVTNLGVFIYLALTSLSSLDG